MKGIKQELKMKMILRKRRRINSKTTQKIENKNRRSNLTIKITVSEYYFKLSSEIYFFFLVEEVI